MFVADLVLREKENVRAEMEQGRPGKQDNKNFESPLAGPQRPVVLKLLRSRRAAKKKRSGATKSPRRNRIQSQDSARAKKEKRVYSIYLLTRRCMAICSARDLTLFCAGPPNDMYSIGISSSRPSLLLLLPSRPLVSAAEAEISPTLACTTSRCALYNNACRSAPEKPSVASAR
jgi:hypothetical protein